MILWKAIAVVSEGAFGASSGEARSLEESKGWQHHFQHDAQV